LRNAEKLAVADYEIDPDAAVPLVEEIRAIEPAENFVYRIGHLLE
jgi:hypothetical protein